LYRPFSGAATAAGGLACASADTLGIRHAFDADHIAVIDDTARLVLLRGHLRRVRPDVGGPLLVWRLRRDERVTGEAWRLARCG
jgi:hypothetical protein